MQIPTPTDGFVMKGIFEQKILRCICACVCLCVYVYVCWCFMCDMETVLVPCMHHNGAFCPG